MIENDNSAKDWLNNADMLTEALPYMQKYAGSIIVIKYGGNAMKDTKSINSFCANGLSQGLTLTMRLCA